MPTNQKFVAKIDSRGLYPDNLVFIGTQYDCEIFANNQNNLSRKNGDFFTYRVCDFYNGQTIYYKDNFAGYFVENLTDYFPSETPDWRKTQLTNGPIGEHKFEGINCLPYKIYGRRKVFSIEFGSVNQILVKNLTGDDLVWINI